jgi:hypothetical protein
MRLTAEMLKVVDSDPGARIRGIVAARIGGQVMNVRTLAWFIWLCVTLQVALVIARLVLEGITLAVQLSLNATFAGSVVDAITTLAFPAVGLLIFLRRPQHPVGWLFCAANFGWTVVTFAGVYARYALHVVPGSLPAGELVVWLYTWPGIISTGLLIYLILLFPSGHLPSRRWRRAPWLLLAWTIIAAAVMALAPGPIDETIGFTVNNPIGVSGPLGHALASIRPLVFPSVFILLATGFVAMVVRQRRASGQERQQLKWFTSSIALVTILFVGQIPVLSSFPSYQAMPGWAKLYNLVGILSTGLVPVAAGIAILRYRLFDIDIIIRRTLVYSLLTLTLGLVYLGGILVSRTLVAPLTGGSELAIVISTLAIAALFMPLRRRIQDIIDRRFYRRKYDAAKVLSAFGTTARDETDLDALTGELLRVVADTMQPEFVGLWLRDPQTRSTTEAAQPDSKPPR